MLLSKILLVLFEKKLSSYSEISSNPLKIKKLHPINILLQNYCPMKKSIALLALASVVLVSCSTTSVTPTETTPVSTTQTESETITPTVAALSLVDLAKHSTQTDCWTAVRGDVYNITGAFGKHKGGDEALMKICGKDGTEIFTKKHGGQENPEKVLASMPKMGKLQ